MSESNWWLSTGAVDGGDVDDDKDRVVPDGDIGWYRRYQKKEKNV